ncbi:MAG: hypothetical protein GY870_13370, partial [archaeon]|nr:hypothetical protein [archaeon]
MQNKIQQHFSDNSIFYFVFMIIFGLRTFLVGLYGVNLPFSDVWDAEAFTLYIPYLKDTLTLNNIWLNHNEHRIVFTKILNLSLFIINNGWNPVLNMVIQSIIPSITGAFFALWYFGNQKKIFILPLCIIVLAYNGIPNYRNTFWSFQSQHYFFMLFSILSFKYASGCDYKIKNILIVFFFAFLSFLGTSGGFITAFTIGILFLFFTYYKSDHKRWWFISALFFLALSFVLYSFVISPSHGYVKPKSILILFVECIKALGWLRWPDKSIYVVLIFIPAAYSLISRFKNNQDEYYLFELAMFLFLLFNVFAICYTRGHASNRHSEILVLIVPIALFCFRDLLQHDSYRIRKLIKIWHLIVILILLLASFHYLERSKRTANRRITIAHTLKKALTLKLKHKTNHNYFRALKIPPKHRIFYDLDRLWLIASDDLLIHHLPSYISPIIPPTEATAINPNKRYSNPSTPLPPSGCEIGTYIGSNNWTGIKTTSFINVPPKKKTVSLHIAGYLEEDKLEIAILQLPANKSLILNSKNKP